MLVYGNQTARESFYGDKKIYRAYLGDKLIFNYDFFWKQSEKNLLIYDGRLIKYYADGTSIFYGDGINDAYSAGSYQTILAKDTGLYRSDTLLCEGTWSRLSFYKEIELYQYSEDGAATIYSFAETVGIVDGEAAGFIESLDYDRKYLVKCGEKVRKTASLYALTDSGRLLNCYFDPQIGLLPPGASWSQCAENVADLCTTCYMKKDGSIYNISSNYLVTTIDSSDVKFFDTNFIADGVICKISGSTVVQSNIGGFSAASDLFAIKDGVLFYTNNMNDITAVPDAPDNFVELSGQVGRTDDNRFFQLTNGPLTEITVRDAE